MNIEDTYYKINRDYLQIIKYNKGVLLLLSYLNLVNNSTLSVNNIFTSLNLIKMDLGLPLSKNIKTGNINQMIKDTLDYLVKSERISLLDDLGYNKLFNITSFEDLTDKRDFILKLINRDIALELSSGYVKIAYKELQLITDVSKKEKINPFTLFNVYIVIKSYIRINLNKINVCYPSLNTLQETTSTDYKTIKKYIDLLGKYELLYVYDFSNKKIVSPYGSVVGFVYSLEECSEKDIIKYIKREID